MTSYDPSRSASNAMMRTISRVSSQIAKSQSPAEHGAATASLPFRRYRSDVPLDGLAVTPPRACPVRRAPWQTASSLVTRQLDPENRSQCSETSSDCVVASEAANYVGDEIQQSNERACKSQSQLESDAESKQKQINRVFMNLKIAEKVCWFNAVGMHACHGYCLSHP